MTQAAGKRLPRTLYGYLLREMGRLIGLTAGVLTTVLAFAISIKPLAEGMLSVDQCLKIIGLSLLPALYYALPFSACFGATLAYYRFASDNELYAAHAGGVSHRAMLVPAALTGSVLAAGLWVLANWHIPIFMRHSAQIVSRNATQVIETTIRQGQPIRYKIDGKPTYVFADMVRAMPARNSDQNAYDRLWLKGILFVTMHEQPRDHPGLDAELTRRVISQGTASEAVIWIAREPTTGPDGTTSVEVVLKPVDYVGIQDGGRAEGNEAIQTFRIPNTFRDDPKFMTLPDLVRARLSPERLPQVNERRRRLAITIAQGEITQRTRELLEAAGSVSFSDDRGTRYLLHARDLRKSPSEDGWYRILPRKGERIGIDQIAPSQDAGATPRITRRSAAEGEFRVLRSTDPISGRENVAVYLRFQSVAVMLDGAVGSGGSGQIEEWRLADLTPTDQRSDEILALSSSELERYAELKIASLSGKNPDRAQPLIEGLRDLRWRAADLVREILSKHHERLAMSLACLAMVLTGAVMAMRLRDKLPLTIYLWAFFPALLTVLLIATGQQFTHKHGWIMTPVLWSGVVGLGAYTALQYRRLAAH